MGTNAAGNAVRAAAGAEVLTSAEFEIGRRAGDHAARELERRAMPSPPVLPQETVDLFANPLRPMAWPSVLHATGLSRAAVYDLMSRGAFPKPHRADRRGAVWLALEIENWLGNRTI